MHPGALYRLIVPLILLAGAVLSREHILALRPGYRELLDGLPYITLAVAVGLGAYYNRARLFTAALALAAAYWTVTTQLQTTLARSEPLYAYSVLSLLLPLGLLALLLVPEKGLRNRYGLALAASVPLLGATAAVTGRFPAAAEALIDAMPVLAFRPFLENYYPSVVASACFAAALVAGLAVLLKRNSEPTAALVGAVLFTFVTLAFFNVPRISLVMFAAAGLSISISLVRSAHEMAYRDELTGLPGRRALNERLRGLGGRYVIAMADVDRFKPLNDTYGHDVGDEVLKMVAAQLKKVKGGGTAYRYGGEEFCLVFGGKTLEQCRPALEAVREKVENYELSLRDRTHRPRSEKEGRQRRGSRGPGKTVAVTVSIGAAERRKGSKKLDLPEQVLKAADTALYKAKRGGRNRVA